MLPRLIPVAVAIAVALPATAGAAQTTFKVVKATHTSSSTKTDAEYNGTSTAKWSLAGATASAPNRVTVSRLNGTMTGLGQVNIRGSYSIDATTRYGHCAWTAATGDDEHPAAAPQPFTLAIGPDPRTGKGAFATFGALGASLGNPYLGTECSTDASGEPQPEETSMVAVKPSAFKRKKVVLRSSGATSREGVDYSWSTMIVLKRR